MQKQSCYVLLEIREVTLKKDDNINMAVSLFFDTFIDMKEKSCNPFMYGS